MPRYFFHLHDAVDSLDGEGTVLADDAAAKAYALSLARYVAAETVAAGELVLSHHVTVLNEGRIQIGVVTFREAINVTD